MGLADWGKIGAFAVDGINTLSKFITKKVRQNEVKSIDRAIDSGDSHAIGNILRRVEKNRESRKDNRP